MSRTQSDARHAYLESIREVIMSEAATRAAQYNLPMAEAVDQVYEAYAEGWEEEMADRRADGDSNLPAIFGEPAGAHVSTSNGGPEE